jgi:hypothetical protein
MVVGLQYFTGDSRAHLNADLNDRIGVGSEKLVLPVVVSLGSSESVWWSNRIIACSDVPHSCETTDVYVWYDIEP